MRARPEEWWNDPDADAIHEWFELTYASYLTISRSLLQSMPPAWQRRFVDCLEEMREHFGDALRDEPRYAVLARDGRGRFMRDPIPHYNRGRTFIPGSEPGRPA